jgi:CHASE2 domain-containing sensor protein/class 3 adenylate cyclase
MSGKLVILSLGPGSVESGFSAVTAQLWTEENAMPIKLIGSLPPTAELAQLSRRWQGIYRALSQRLVCPTRIRFEPEELLQVSEVEFEALCQQLPQTINQWLRSADFIAIEQQLRRELHPYDEVRVILETNDGLARRLPWHLWQFFADYPKANIGLSALEYERHPLLPHTPKDSVRILAILGNSTNLDLTTDRQLLATLPRGQVVWLEEPSLQDLHEQLWSETGWDILFFAGHSQMAGNTGRVQLNSQDSLAIHELKYALKTAIGRGLQLAIFNSCEGLGLARELADLQIPQLIVMREPVPDQVAQRFLRYFLQSFSQNKPLYLAVREAQERLEGLEKEFPCASWLPVICQNPAVSPPTWQSLCRGVERRNSPRDDVVTMVFTDLVNSTAVKNFLAGHTLEHRNHTYLEQILKPHRDRITANLKGYRGRLVRTEGDACFLVFANAALTARWAVGVQRSHDEDPIPTPLGPLKLRLGMHTGSPLHDGPDFIGQEVDYAARVSALAQGGQILLSEATATLIRNTAIDGYRVQPYGDHPLKGIGTVPLAELCLPTAHDSPDQQHRPEKSARRWRQRLALGLGWGVLSALGLVAIRYAGVLQPLELQAYDQLLRWRPAEPIDSRLLVVEVTEADVQTQPAAIDRRGSLSDQSLLALLQRLEPYSPRVIGLDIYRNYPVAPDVPELQTRLQASGNLFAVCKVRDDGAQIPELAPPPELSPEFLGFSDTVLDRDGPMRRHLLSMTPEVGLCSTPYSLSVQLAAAYLQRENISLSFTDAGAWQWGDRRFRPMTAHWGSYQRIDAGGHQIMLNYRRHRSPIDAFPRVTLAQVLEGSVREEFIRDRIILIGTTAPSYKDYSPTPYRDAQGRPLEVPGVILQAQMTSQLLSYGLDSRPLIWVWPVWGDTLWILIWACLGSLIALAIKRVSWAMLALGITLVFLSLMSWVIFAYWGGWVPWVPAALAVLVSGGGAHYWVDHAPLKYRSQ